MKKLAIDGGKPLRPKGFPERFPTIKGIRYNYKNNEAFYKNWNSIQIQ